MAAPLNFHLEQYDGPLDLLLDLIRKQEIDIYNIPIAQITQPRRPGRHALAEAAVAVGAARIGHPAGEPWRAVAFPVDDHLRLLPRECLGQLVPQSQRVDPLLLQPAGLMAQPQARPFNADQGNASDTP